MAHIGASQETETIFQARGIKFLNQVGAMSNQELLDAKLTQPQAARIMQMSHDIIELICAPMASHQIISTSSHLSKYNQKRNHHSKTRGPVSAPER